MTLNEFLKYVETRKPLKGDEVHQFMNEMSDEARRMTFELNGSYHDPEEIRELLSRLFNKPVDPSFRVFPPFYTDFGKNGRLKSRVIFAAKVVSLILIQRFRRIEQKVLTRGKKLCIVPRSLCLFLPMMIKVI